MNRRRRIRADSLDLLLDTICNTFGGILFIAILVIIMLQMRGTHPDIDASEIERQREQLTADQSRLDEELARLQQTIAGQQELISKLAPANVQDLLQELAKQESELAALSHEQETLLQTSETKAKERTNLVSDIHRTAETIHELEMEIESLSSQFDRERSERKKVLRTTYVRPPGSKQEVSVVIEYDRFYVWHRYSPIGIRLGLNTDDFIILEDNGRQLETAPNPVAGIPLGDAPELSTQIRNRLRHFSPKTTYLSVVVRPDSFDSFCFFRDVITDLGFEYRLMPTTGEDSIADRGGIGDQVQ